MRDLDRERMHLERQEKQVVMEIKKLAKEGQTVRTCCDADGYVWMWRKKGRDRYDPRVREINLHARIFVIKEVHLCLAEHSPNHPLACVIRCPLPAICV